MLQCKGNGDVDICVAAIVFIFLCHKYQKKREKKQNFFLCVRRALGKGKTFTSMSLPYSSFVLLNPRPQYTVKGSHCPETSL